MAAHDPADARAGAVPGEALLATVVTGLPQDGNDVRRRDMITRTAALAGAAALSRAPGGTGSPRNPAGGLEDVLYGHVEAAPVDAGRLRAAVTAARGDFRDARYDRVPAALPKIVAAAAQATRDNAGAGERAEASGLLADAYLLAADFAVKVNDDPLSWTTSDRALQAAQASGDPLAIADARRAVATAMRRAHHPARAVDMLVRACRDIEPDGNAGPDHLATYGNLLTVAAYTAATAGNRRAAGEYMAEAASVAARLGSATSSRQQAASIRPGRAHALPGQHRPGTRRQRDRHRPRAQHPGCRHPHPRAAGPLLGRRRPRLAPVGKTRSLLPRPARRRARRARRGPLPPARPPHDRRPAQSRYPQLPAGTARLRPPRPRARPLARRWD